MDRRAPVLLISTDEIRLINWADSMFAQELDESCQTALFIRAKMKVNVPAQIIPSKVVIVLATILDNGVERFHAEIFRSPELPAQTLVVEPAAQCPNCVDKRQTGQLIPGGSQVPNLVGRRGMDKIQSGIPDEQSKV